MERQSGSCGFFHLCLCIGEKLLSTTLLPTRCPLHYRDDYGGIVTNSISRNHPLQHTTATAPTSAMEPTTATAPTSAMEPLYHRLLKIYSPLKAPTSAMDRLSRPFQIYSINGAALFKLQQATPIHQRSRE